MGLFFVRNSEIQPRLLSYSTKMMKKIFARLKPGAPIHVHLLVAALIWSLVGTFLISNGFILLVLADREWLALPAIGLGIMKSVWVLDRVAKKNIRRILQLEDGSCIGSVYSLRTWALVLCMVAFGRILRQSVLPGEYVGMLYLAVGSGLFCSSRLMWFERFKLPR